ncbi:MAG: M23 family metallopeptidase [Calditrichaeota bacterium]|nr:M23 family metallopeptidase [Calditrichota bacterium]
MAAALKVLLISAVLPLLISVGQIEAARLLWPLPESSELTSGYGERRSNHFHGGLDIRTQGRELECVAVDGGWVERVAVSPEGYGRTIYPCLSDGRTAVYAHLSRFAPKLETILRERQLQAEVYRVDFPLDSQAVTFQRGETIAWTGCSGIGASHLHFELRRGAVQLDPYPDYEEKDTRKPVISGLRIVEVLDEHAARYSQGREIRLEKDEGRHFIGHASVAEGTPFALFLKAHDALPYGQHRPWVRCVLLREDTKDTLADVRRKGIDLLAPTTLWASVDFAAWRYQHQEWWRLHAGKVGDFVPFPALRNKTEDLLLDVYDAAGNQARIQLGFREGKEREVQYHDAAAHSVSISEQGLNGFELALDSQERAPQLEFLAAESSDEVHLSPELGFYRKATLTWTSPTGGLESGTYLYQKFGKSKRFLTAEPDSSGRRLVAKIPHTGTFGIGRDTRPPQLSIRVEGREIVFEAKDAETGIDTRTVRCRVDGRTAIAEYEPEESGGRIWMPFELSNGEHEIRLQADDKVGNRATLEKVVHIGQGKK